MAVTRARSSSLSPKKGYFANPKWKGRKKTIDIKSKVTTVGTQLVKRKQHKIIHIERRRKQKGLNRLL